MVLEESSTGGISFLQGVPLTECLVFMSEIHNIEVVLPIRTLFRVSVIRANLYSEMVMEESGGED